MADAIQKQWGWTLTVVQSPLCEIHRIDVRAGGFCSWHQHDRKHNVFTVVRGKLVVEIQTEPGKVLPDQLGSRHLLLPGDSYDVPPGMVHRFRCPEATCAIETYYPASIDPADIYRFSEGGVE